MTRALALFTAAAATVLLSGCGKTLFIGDSLMLGQSPQSGAYTPKEYFNNALALANKPAGTFLGGPGAGPCDIEPRDHNTTLVFHENDYVYNNVVRAAPDRVVIALNGNPGLPKDYVPGGCAIEVPEKGIVLAYTDSLTRMIDSVRRANFTGPIELMNPVPLPKWFGGALWASDVESGNPALRAVLARVAVSRTNVTVSDAAFQALASPQGKWTDLLPCSAAEVSGGFCQSMTGYGNLNVVRSPYTATTPTGGADGGLHWYWGWTPPGKTAPYSAGAQRYAEALTRSSR